VGGARTKDLAGRPVDASADFPGGYKGDGVPGLQAFIKAHRQDNFIDNLSRKLLAYALNRSTQMSDEALLDKMKAGLAAHDDHFSALVEAIVVSPQFLNRREPEKSFTQRADLEPADIKLMKTASRKGN